MDIAVIGAGNVGRALARGWAQARHRVWMGMRTPPEGDDASAVAAGEAIITTGVEDAIAAAEVVVYAIPGTAMPETLAAHLPLLSGRTVVDATNPSASSERTAGAAGVPVIRAFNSVGWENFTASEIAGVRPDLVFAAPDGTPRQIAERLIGDLGPRPVWAGADEAAYRAVDGLATLWFALAFGRGMGRRLAFRVLTPDDARDSG
jgi:predicted dinucleotide-binding enzyme